MTVMCEWCERNRDFPSLSFPKECGICRESRCSRHRLKISHSYSGTVFYICHDKHLGMTLGEILARAERELGPVPMGPPARYSPEEEV